ncbi:MAG: RluA family pseudouridine synthase [Ezakiella sp.]|nr:RluA family pseudouridine synthase [Ezakiella sp.]MDD7471954.1 RluA family pseudouridine synthase [Bacillota bacterium]MDY3923918.1 RluA family pseudouridine synthase [Ezakiella sp.]
MINIEVKQNDANQRIDRFLLKLMPNANKNFMMRMLREKKIKLNKEKADPSKFIQEGDSIQIYFSDETFDKFSYKEEKSKNNIKLDIVYEDENIAILDKPSGVLCHFANNLKEPNLVDSFISYLTDKREYNPRDEHSFVPSLCNRLDRNTSGLVIAAKNAESLRKINELIKEHKIKKYYFAIVKGELIYDGYMENSYSKNENKNMMNLEKNLNSGKMMKSKISTIKSGKDFSLIKVELITGKTHQIRLQLKTLGAPIIGDNKYGDIDFNNKLNVKNTNHQKLVSGEIVFPKIEGNLSYLSNKKFVSKYKSELFNLYKFINK